MMGHLCLPEALFAYLHTCTLTYLNICIYAYFHTCKLTYLHNLHTCIFAYMHICIDAYLHTSIFAYMHICIHAHLHTCTFAYMNIWKHAHLHMSDVNLSIFNIQCLTSMHCITRIFHLSLCFNVLSIPTLFSWSMLVLRD
jgi:hypothetical protein